MTKNLSEPVQKLSPNSSRIAADIDGEQPFSGWTFSTNGGETHHKLETGKRVTIDFGGERRETYLVIQDDVLCLEQVFKDDSIAYYEMEPGGRIIRQQLPYPLSQYSIIIDEDQVVERTRTQRELGYVEDTTRLKWGAEARCLKNSDGELVDYLITGRCRFEHPSKRIFIGDS